MPISDYKKLAPPSLGGATKLCMYMADRFLDVADSALRTLFAKPRSLRPHPVLSASETRLTPEEQRNAAALMRVNHVGEICAQALYTAQALATSNTTVEARLNKAAEEETDHLAWTAGRLAELGGRPSLLNPLWYAGAFGLGLLAGKLGDKVGLGFVVETERQVEAHLQHHLDWLPTGDHASRAIVTQMKNDEAAHAAQALQAGAAELPRPVKILMKMAAKLMTITARYI